MKVYNRIAKTLSMLLLGAGQEMVFQLLSTLIWIRTWGVDLYSEWLLLFIFPNLIIRGNVGVFHSASSNLIVLFSQQRIYDAKTQYHSLSQAKNILLVLIASILFVATSVLIYFNYFKLITQKDLILISILLFAQIALFQSHQQLLCLLKAIQKTSTAVYWQNLFRLSMIVPMLLFPFYFKPAVCLFAAVVSQIVMIMLTRRSVLPILARFPSDGSKSDKKVMQQILKEGMQFSSFPFFQTAIHTFSVWSLGLVFGPVSGAVWHNMRTISRGILILARAGEQSIRWELSAMISSNDMKNVKTLLRRTKIVSTLALIVACFVSIVFGKYVFLLLTDNQLEFHFYVYVVLCLGALFYSFSQLYLAVPFSINKHGKITHESIWVFCFVLLMTIPVAKLGYMYLAILITISDLIILLRARVHTLSILESVNKG